MLKQSFISILFIVCVYQISTDLGNIFRTQKQSYHAVNETSKNTNGQYITIVLPLSELERIIWIDEVKFRYQGKSYRLIQQNVQNKEITIVGVLDIDSNEKSAKPFLRKKAAPIKKDPTLAKRRIA